jgi:N-acetylglucosaminyldiphosphoundecaprenol N-acetyl-beta-D-mannosaminyltransferase
MARLPSADLLGVHIDNVTEEDVIDHILSCSAAGQGGWIATPNTDFLRQIVNDPNLAALIRQADLAIPDGMPLIWASRLQGTPLQKRVSASQLIYPLCTAAAERGLTIFMLGGEPGIGEAAAEVLRSQTPDLQVVGTYAPPLGFESDERVMASIVDRLVDTRPGIVFCAFGFPKQERLITELRLHCPASWFIGVGGTLTMVSGRTPHAPRWMRRSGLEWLHRLRLEPRRLFRRYIIDDGPFALRLLTMSAMRNVTGRARRTDKTTETVGRLPESE